MIDSSCCFLCLIQLIVAASWSVSGWMTAPSSGDFLAHTQQATTYRIVSTQHTQFTVLRTDRSGLDATHLTTYRLPHACRLISELP